MDRVIFNELTDIQEKIRYNYAKLDDYKRYEQILVENGFSEDEILSELRKNGIYSWGQYLERKKMAKTFAEKLKDGELTGWILGLGGALLLYWALKKDK